MAWEIERKFLVKGDEWRKLGEGVLYRQGYISVAVRSVVRVRTVGKKGCIGIKSLVNDISRREFEYEIPLTDANEMLDTVCMKPLIEKHRYTIRQGELVWEVDEFHGENEGLIVAEVELTDENQPVALPAWVGEEVSGDPKYLNANLVKHPFNQW
ncbi:MAG: CYTH domain-containing protein [Alphaproteobacteria bacterium]